MKKGKMIYYSEEVRDRNIQFLSSAERNATLNTLIVNNDLKLLSPKGVVMQALLKHTKDFYTEMSSHKKSPKHASNLL